METWQIEAAIEKIVNKKLIESLTRIEEDIQTYLKENLAEAKHLSPHVRSVDTAATIVTNSIKYEVLKLKGVV